MESTFPSTEDGQPVCNFVIKIQNYIGGQLVAPASDQWLENVEPATGSVYANVPDSDAQDIEMAVEAANRAFAGWAGLSNGERAGFLHPAL